MLSNENFEEVYPFSECGIALVKRCNGRFNYLKNDGTFLCKNDFIAAKIFEKNEIALVKLDEKAINFIRKDGNFVLKKGIFADFESAYFDELKDAIVIKLSNDKLLFASKFGIKISD